MSGMSFRQVRLEGANQSGRVFRFRCWVRSFRVFRLGDFR